MATYSLELKLNTKKASDCRYLENYFREVAKISNTVRRFAMRRIERLKRDKKYRELLTQYIKLDKGEEKDAVSKKLSAVVWSYGLTKFHLQKTALDLRKNLRYVHSTVYQLNKVYVILYLHSSGSRDLRISAAFLIFSFKIPYTL